MKGLLNIDEMAELLRLKPKTIYKYTSNGQIPFYKVGNRVLFKEDDIWNWVMTKKVEPA